MDKQLLGRRIYRARKDRSITSERLSEICNINATYLRQIESGAKMPSLPLFVLLCEKLQVSPSWLLADQIDPAITEEPDAIVDLCRSLTPSQMRLFNIIIRSVITGLSEQPNEAQ